MFAELVCGPPGSGKTTYCEGKRQFLSAYDPRRPVIIVNLDPANEGIFPYPCDVDIRMLVNHRIVAETESLGPNGAYIFCAQVIAARADWILEQVIIAIERKSAESPECDRAPHVIFDCPGQVEFYLVSDVVEELIHRLQKKLLCSVGMVHFVDGSVCTRDVSSYVSSCLLALNVMTKYEVPMVNVLTKWDLVELDDKDSFLSPVTILESFDFWWRRFEFSGTEKMKHMALSVLNVVEGYGVVGYLPLDVQSQNDMLLLTTTIDNALGNFV